MTEEIIINKEICSRYWNGNCTGDDELLIGACPDFNCERKQLLRLKQENDKLKEIASMAICRQDELLAENERLKQEVSKLSDKVPQMIMRNKELEKENEELKKTLHQPDFILALADVSNGERERRINRLSRYEQALRRIFNRTRLMLSIHSKRIATNGELFSIISEAHALTNEVLKCQKY